MYFNKDKHQITNDEGAFYVKRILDKSNRTIEYWNLDRNKKPKNEDDFGAKYVYTMDDNHKIKTVFIFDESGTPALHLSDYHLAYEYDEQGNVRKISSLDSESNPIYDDNGVSIYEFTYDSYDRKTSEKRFGSNYEPIVANDDYFLEVTEYDLKGKITFEAKYYPGYVLQFSDKMWGATKYEYEGDTIIYEVNLDAFNDFIENDDNVTKIKKIIDGEGRVKSEIYLDSINNFAKTSNNIVQFKYRYDANGYQSHHATYDSIGNPIAFEEDVALVKWKYDNRGNKLETSYYNTSGNLAYANDGVTYNIYEYNNKDLLIESRNLSIERKPAEFKKTYKKKIVYNRFRKDSIVWEFNAKEQLKAGIAITKYYYNRFGNKVLTEYYDSNNNRTKNKNLISAQRILYSERQQIIGYEFLDEKNRLTNNNNGIAKEVRSLNERGHLMSLSFLNKSKKPVLGTEGYHMIKYEWGPMAETSKVATYNTNLSLIEDELGTAIYEYKLEPSGIYSEVKRLNDKGILSDNANGVAITRYTPYLNGLYYFENDFNAQGDTVSEED